jgi:hypothetical protein
MPIPANPAPEQLTYAQFRTLLEDFVAELDAARELLLQAGDSGDYVVELDVLAIRLDVDGDGVADEGEVIGVLLGASGPNGGWSSPPTAPSPDGGRGGGASKNAPTAPPPGLEIGFDRADALWLAGYSQILAAQADFLLAHDFEELVNVAFHRLFPQAGLPMQDYSEGGTLMMDPATDSAAADLVAAIHTINWPVVEPERLRRVLERLQAVTQLSRRNWEAILAETDDNAELLPNPRQTSPMPDTEVTEEVVAAWMETLDTVDLVLAGELLVPHWRFKQGFDLKAYFETAMRTDMVMLLTGYDALPYLRDGPIADADSFAAGNRVFGSRFPDYAFWFN